jgi:hypothetical protein
VECGVRTVSSLLRIGKVKDTCNFGNDSGFIKCVEFLD